MVVNIFESSRGVKVVCGFRYGGRGRSVFYGGSVSFGCYSVVSSRS